MDGSLSAVPLALLVAGLIMAYFVRKHIQKDKPESRAKIKPEVKATEKSVAPRYKRWAKRNRKPAEQATITVHQPNGKVETFKGRKVPNNQGRRPKGGQGRSK